MSKIAHNLKEKKRTCDVSISENISFDGLLLSKRVLNGLKSSGFEKPSPIQLKAIPLGRCGLDLIVQAKSGTGKTCVFSVIALENIHTDTSATQVLVLAPTREIAVQIWEVINSIGCAMKGLECHTFIGGLPLHEDRMKLKKCHIAVGSPGRIKQLIEGGVLRAESVRLFVLDEADKLLEEGFQEQINWIYSTLPENKQMLALSATYPEYLAEHLTAYMRNPTFIRLSASDPALLGIRQYFASVAYHPVSHVVFEEKVKVLTHLLSSVSFQQCLIFSNLQTRAQTLAEHLSSHGWPTACIAGCLDQKERNHAMAKLKTYKCRILISTDLTARGIDADKVNMVVNLDIPKDHETYLHRIGRAGRFGAFGIAVSLISEGQERLDLNSIEKRCNTRVNPLPEPLPSDLARADAPVYLEDVVSTEVLHTTKGTTDVDSELCAGNHGSHRTPASELDGTLTAEADRGLLTDGTSLTGTDIKPVSETEKTADSEEDQNDASENLNGLNGHLIDSQQVTEQEILLNGVGAENINSKFSGNSVVKEKEVIRKKDENQLGNVSKSGKNSPEILPESHDIVEICNNNSCDMERANCLSEVDSDNATYSESNSLLYDATVEEGEQADSREDGDMMVNSLPYTKVQNENLTSPSTGLKGAELCTESRGDEPCTESRGAEACTESRGDEMCTESRGDEPCTESRGAEACTESRGAEPCTESRGAEACTESRGDELCTESRGAEAVEESNADITSTKHDPCLPACDFLSRSDLTHTPLKSTPINLTAVFKHSMGYSRLSSCSTYESKVQSLRSFRETGTTLKAEAPNFKFPIIDKEVEEHREFKSFVSKIQEQLSYHMHRASCKTDVGETMQADCRIQKELCGSEALVSSKTNGLNLHPTESPSSQLQDKVSQNKQTNVPISKTDEKVAEADGGDQNIKAETAVEVKSKQATRVGYQGKFAIAHLLHQQQPNDIPEAVHENKKENAEKSTDIYSVLETGRHGGRDNWKISDNTIATTDETSSSGEELAGSTEDSSGDSELSDSESAGEHGESDTDITSDTSDVCLDPRKLKREPFAGKAHDTNNIAQSKTFAGNHSERISDHKTRIGKSYEANWKQWYDVYRTWQSSWFTSQHRSAFSQPETGWPRYSGFSGQVPATHYNQYYWYYPSPQPNVWSHDPYYGVSYLSYPPDHGSRTFADVMDFQSRYIKEMCKYANKGRNVSTRNSKARQQ